MKLDRVIAVRNNKTVYRDGDTCVKVFRDEFSTGDILHEAMNQARLYELCKNESAFRVPQVLEVTRLDGRWAIITEFVRGKDLELLARENPANGDTLCKQFTALQWALHQLACPLLSRMQDKLDAKIALTTMDATHRFSLHSRLAELPRNTVSDNLSVCHGDFVPSNVILTEDGVPYIIDWSHATQGNAAADAARTYIALLLRDTPGEAARYLACYCETAGISTESVLAWVPVVAAALTVRCSERERERLIPMTKLTELAGV